VIALLSLSKIKERIKVLIKHIKNILEKKIYIKEEYSIRKNVKRN
jgi:hypothetical protein